VAVNTSRLQKATRARSITPLLDNTYSYSSFNEILLYQIDTLQVFKHPAMPRYIDKMNKIPRPYPECKKPVRPNPDQKPLSKSQPDGHPAPPYEPPPIYEEGEASEKGQEKMGSDGSWDVWREHIEEDAKESILSDTSNRKGDKKGAGWTVRKCGKVQGGMLCTLNMAKGRESPNSTKVIVIGEQKSSTLLSQNGCHGILPLSNES
jgi:hypothetical protein